MAPSDSGGGPQMPKVKVAFHLDHGANDEVITKALRWGCTGVMRDASASAL